MCHELETLNTIARRRDPRSRGSRESREVARRARQIEERRLLGLDR